MELKNSSKRDLTEKQVDDYIRRECKRRNCECIKLETNFHSGLPDRMILVPGGKVVFCEVKRPGKVPAPLQMAVARKFNSLDQMWMYADSPEMFDTKMRTFLDNWDTLL